MSCIVERFDGRTIEGSRSMGSGVFAAFDWEQMVPAKGPAIAEKALTEQGRVTDFPPADHSRLKAKLGHYSKVQSVNSEDTVTWGVFGLGSIAEWLPELLDLAFESASRPAAWETRLWSRDPHPDTGCTANGPEADVVVTAPGWRIDFEAKWRQDIDGKQGRSRTLSQLDMRANCARSCAGDESQWGVLVIAPSSRIYPKARTSNSVFRRYFEPSADGYRPLAAAHALHAAIVTWEQILSILRNHPAQRPRSEYLDWRLRLLD
jgi:hypothetical protein